MLERHFGPSVESYVSGASRHSVNSSVFVAYAADRYLKQKFLELVREAPGAFLRSGGRVRRESSSAACTAAVLSRARGGAADEQVAYYAALRAQFRPIRWDSPSPASGAHILSLRPELGSRLIGIGTVLLSFCLLPITALYAYRFRANVVGAGARYYRVQGRDNRNARLDEGRFTSPYTGSTGIINLAIGMSVVGKRFSAKTWAWAARCVTADHAGGRWELPQWSYAGSGLRRRAAQQGWRWPAPSLAAPRVKLHRVAPSVSGVGHRRRFAHILRLSEREP